MSATNIKLHSSVAPFSGHYRGGSYEKEFPVLPPPRRSDYFVPFGKIVASPQISSISSDIDNKKRISPSHPQYINNVSEHGKTTVSTVIDSDTSSFSATTNQSKDRTSSSRGLSDCKVCTLCHYIHCIKSYSFCSPG